MLETPHVAVGAAIASQIPNPLISLPLALASHFILEKIPHWNPHLNTETEKYGRPTLKSTLITAVDSTLALTLGIFIASRFLPDLPRTFTILSACFISVLPDVVEGPYFFLGVRNQIIKRWIAWQKSIQIDASPLPGLATQSITILAALCWIFT